MIPNDPDDWLITWPNIDGPIPVECTSCKLVYDESAMRRPLSAAERELGRSGWVSTLVCNKCRAAKERTLTPAALRRKLVQQGALPPAVIDMRVAQAKEKSRIKSSKSARARWADEHAESTSACLKAIDREKAQFRARAYYLANSSGSRVGAAPAFVAYADLLAYVMTCVRMRAKDGKAPITPWQENLYITPVCCRMLAVVVEQLVEAGRAHPTAFNAGYPSWWSDRDRLLAAKAPPKEKRTEDDAPLDPTDFDSLVARARSQWDKRNGGTRKMRKPRTIPFYKTNEVVDIPGVDPAFTADDLPPRRPRAAPGPKLSAAERLALMKAELNPGRVHAPLTPRSVPPPPPDLRPYIDRLGLRVTPAGQHQTRVLPAPIAPRTPEEMAAD